MLLYSHLVIAQKMQPLLCPQDLPEYYWGAVAADVRYYSRMRRAITHPPLEEVRLWQDEYPALQSFILGYRVHILADERDAVSRLYENIPWRSLRKRLSRGWARYLLEAVYIERCRFDAQISGTYNPLLENLGVTRETVEVFASAVIRYAAQPSFEKAVTLLSESGRTVTPRLKNQLVLAAWLQGAPRIRRALLGLINEKAVTQRVVADLHAHF
jgi:hypothetical protein